MKNLQETFIFSHLNTGNRIIDNIGKIIEKGRPLTREDLLEQFMIMEKTIKTGLKNRVMEAFETKKILLVYSPPGVKMPTAMPWFLTQNPTGDIVAVILVDLYGSMNADGDIKIDVTKLYSLMESAFVGRNLFLNGKNLPSRTNLITNGSAIYANIFTHQLNKKYALNIDKNKQTKLILLASKFFMINLLGMKPSQIVDNYAMRNCHGGNNIILQDVLTNFPDTAFKNFSTFVTEIINNDATKDIVPGLTVRGYLEQFIFLMDGSALLMLEALPYFISNILSVMNRAYTNNQYNLENLIGPYGKKIYVDLMNL